MTDASAAAIKMTLYRLKQSGAIVTPRRDFFVVVPREYRAAGCPPASWFIDDLMRHMGRRSYVGLLTAAALHGAGHQQPMAFQVIMDSAERDIEVGRVRIEFHISSVFTGAAAQPMQTETGTMQVATPETTAFDLVRFPAAAGNWSNIATVLSELAEKLDLEALVELFRRPAFAEGPVFRGGTALHKLFFEPPGRYSEDIDLVQRTAGPIGPLVDGIRAALDPWLGKPKWNAGQGRFPLYYRFDTTFTPVVQMRVKIEINSREHFSVHGYTTQRVEVANPWFSGHADVPTFSSSSSPPHASPSPARSRRASWAPA